MCSQPSKVLKTCSQPSKSLETCSQHEGLQNVFTALEGSQNEFTPLEGTSIVRGWAVERCSRHPGNPSLPPQLREAGP